MKSATKFWKIVNEHQRYLIKLLEVSLAGYPLRTKFVIKYILEHNQDSKSTKWNAIVVLIIVVFVNSREPLAKRACDLLVVRNNGESHFYPHVWGKVYGKVVSLWFLAKKVFKFLKKLFKIVFSNLIFGYSFKMTILMKGKSFPEM